MQRPANLAKEKLVGVGIVDDDFREGKGFKLKDVNVPSKNFPRTGFNGAFFNLVLDNVTAKEVITQTGVRVAPESGTGVIIKLEEGASDNIRKIRLIGANHTTKGGKFTPATFKIKAGNTIVYSFKVSKWFVGKSTLELYKDAERYCSRLPNYRMAELKGITNAHDPGKGFPSNTPGWTKPSPARMIGDGTSNGVLLAEWGDIKDYDNAFSFINYAWSKGNPYIKVFLNSKGGVENDRRNNAVASYMCVSK